MQTAGCNCCTVLQLFANCFLTKLRFPDIQAGDLPRQRRGVGLQEGRIAAPGVQTVPGFGRNSWGPSDNPWDKISNFLTFEKGKNTGWKTAETHQQT